MKLVINIIFCFIAGLLTYLTPNRYDYNFCVSILGYALFILGVSIYKKHIDKLVKVNAHDDFYKQLNVL